MKITDKKMLAVLALAFAVVAVVAWFAVGAGGGTSGVPGPAKPAQTRPKAAKRPMLTQSGASRSVVKVPYFGLGVRDEMHGARTKMKAKVGGAEGGLLEADGRPVSQTEVKFVVKARTAVEKDDVAAAREVAAAALKSASPKVRSSAVEALGWFGAKCLAELTPFLSDTDGEVADFAKDQWLDALQEIENDGEKAGVIELALKAITDPELASEVANELVGIDELAAIQVVANLVSDKSNPVAAAAVVEAYGDITGEDWNGVAAAEAYLQEHYIPPDPE